MRSFDESYDAMNALQKQASTTTAAEALSPYPHHPSLYLCHPSCTSASPPCTFCQGDDAYRLEAFDFGRRMAVEREYRAAIGSTGTGGAPPSNVIFDASGR